MPNMAVDVMQSATFELNRSSALHDAQTNPAMAKETKRTCIFANGNSVGDSVGLPLQSPKIQPVFRFI